MQIFDTFFVAHFEFFAVLKSTVQKSFGAFFRPDDKNSSQTRRLGRRLETPPSKWAAKLAGVHFTTSFNRGRLCLGLVTLKWGSPERVTALSPGGPPALPPHNERLIRQKLQSQLEGCVTAASREFSRFFRKGCENLLLRSRARNHKTC